jgi:hypothetical protein
MTTVETCGMHTKTRVYLVWNSLVQIPRHRWNCNIQIHTFYRGVVIATSYGLDGLGLIPGNTGFLSAPQRPASSAVGPAGKAVGP